MTEERILELFNKINDDRHDNLLGYSKLRRATAANISKTIADVVYESANAKNPIVLNKRKDCLVSAFVYLVRRLFFVFFFNF